MVVVVVAAIIIVLTIIPLLIIIMNIQYDKNTIVLCPLPIILIFSVTL